MSSSVGRPALGIVWLALVAGCGLLQAPPPPKQAVVVRVNADPGTPIEGAEIYYNGQKVAVTNAEGVGKLGLSGRDGDTFDIKVKCPERFTSPATPTQVVLRRLLDRAKLPEYLVLCPPTTRTVVVAVRAENGPNLPVLYLGREVARTDVSGAATVMLRLMRDEQFDLTLGTSEPGNERLRPQNPSSAFFVAGHDDVFTFDAKFELEAIRKVVAKGRPPPCKIGVNCK